MLVRLAPARIAGEIEGIRKVAILELKKGGFCVAQKEVDQARDYSKEIRKAGRVQANTEIVAYVLGATLEQGLEQMTVGEKTTIIPMVYQTVLRKAHQRTFNLHLRTKKHGSLNSRGGSPTIAADEHLNRHPGFDAETAVDPKNWTRK